MAKGFNIFNINNILYASQNLQCFDKLNFLNVVRSIGLLVPKTFLSIVQIDIPFPIFYKQKYEQGGGLRGIAYTQSDLDKLKDSNNLIFQEYIPGRSTYGVGFIAQKGELLTTFVHEEFLSLPVQGGSAVCIRKFEDERLIEYTKRIVKNINYSGWGLTEYKYCQKRKDYVFMEVNAKLWASIEFALLNNNEFLKYLLDLDYKKKIVFSAVFIDRLLSLEWAEFFKAFKFVCFSRIITYKTHFQLLKTILSKSFPMILKLKNSDGKIVN